MRFKPPADAVDGQTVGRFRFSSLGGLRPTGLALDGEVEDYAVNILAGTPPDARNDSYTSNEDETGTTLLGSVLANDINSTPGSNADGADLSRRRRRWGRWSR